ncbi:MAG TPA: TIGR04283 family arsenosugar biosynthesis glycosyltransferase, partial [Burkholderiaceae bacterium]|nr:TIGR04283 family arsenosugar biosynthesis glycosyltransferase [Burkholderiaceae bacterium]
RGAQVMVVDGGSSDATAALAKPYADRVLQSARGRAQQMNAGAKAALDAGADVLLFVHADSELPDSADHLIDTALRSGGRVWGRFDVRIDAEAPMLKVVSAMMNWRSRLTGICTGDQAIFVTGAAFERLAGFAPIALMEDIDFSKRAKHLSWPVAIEARVVTSARRWLRHGIWRTIVLMWRFRIAYFFGADPQRLAQRYRNAR